MTQEERRQKMPLCTSHIDGIRKAFGAENVVYIKAQENGLSVEWGTPLFVHVANAANETVPSSQTGGER